MIYNTKPFQERYDRWKNGENYWEIVGSPLPQYQMGKDIDSTYQFVQRIAPIVAANLRQRGNMRAFNNIMRQLAFESNYGRSDVARKLHNYGGVRIGGSTKYRNFNNDKAFIDYYMGENVLGNDRYNGIYDAKDSTTYANILKKGGYYEDSVPHYAGQLSNMKLVDKHLATWQKANPGWNHQPLLLQTLQPIEQAVDNTYVARPAMQIPVKPKTSTQNTSVRNTMPQMINIPRTDILPPVEQTIQRIMNGQDIMPQHKYGKDGLIQSQPNTFGLELFPIVDVVGQSYEPVVDTKSRLMIPNYSNGKDSIHIAKSKRGTFTAAATKHGMSVQQFANVVLNNPDNYSTAMRKKANFAKNASKWKH